MLPSRPTLQSWNPDSLSPAASAVETGGESVYGAVRHLDDECHRLDEARGWQGKAQKAAGDMFNRATKQASKFKDYAEAVGLAFENGDHEIGAARRALLNKADEIDQGELHVSDQWVVLIKPAEMSAEEVADLQQQAEAEQEEVNLLLSAVGDADDHTAAAVQAAAENVGFEPPDRNSPFYGMKEGEIRPGDEVPNPRTIQGLNQQGLIRGEDMGVAVRKSSETTDKDGNHITKMTMQDGSKHVVTEYNRNPPHGNPLPGNLVQDEHFDAHGGFISQTQTQRSENGTETTNIIWADGTQFIGTATPDGTRTAAFTLPDGRHGVLPPDNPFFTGAAPKMLGGALTGLEAHVGRGGGIPGLTPESVKGVGQAARYAGPALGIAATIYGMGVAETPHEACVAGISGTFGVAGDYIGGTAGAAAGGLVPFGEAFTVPFGATLGAAGGGGGLGWIGQKVGEAFCPA